MAYRSAYETIRGRVRDRYKLSNGSLGVILEDEITHSIYAVELPVGERRRGLRDLLYNDGNYFARAGPHAAKLASKGNYLDLTVRRSYAPTKYATHLNRAYSARYRSRNFRGGVNAGYQRVRTYGQGVRY